MEPENVQTETIVSSIHLHLVQAKLYCSKKLIFITSLLNKLELPTNNIIDFNNNEMIDVKPINGLDEILKYLEPSDPADGPEILAEHCTTPPSNSQNSTPPSLECLTPPTEFLPQSIMIENLNKLKEIQVHHDDTVSSSDTEPESPVMNIFSLPKGPLRTKKFNTLSKLRRRRAKLENLKIMNDDDQSTRGSV